MNKLEKQIIEESFPEKLNDPAIFFAMHNTEVVDAIQQALEEYDDEGNLMENAQQRHVNLIGGEGQVMVLLNILQECKMRSIYPRGEKKHVEELSVIDGGEVVRLTVELDCPFSFKGKPAYGV